MQKVFERTREDFTDMGDPSVATFGLLESQFKTNNGPQNTPAAIIHGIFETGSSFCVELCAAVGIQFLLSGGFLLGLVVFLFRGDWALGNDSMGFEISRRFPNFLTS